MGNEIAGGNGSGEVTSYNQNFADSFFSVYKRLHEEKEELKKIYKNSVMIEFEDLKELHYKTIQVITSLHPAQQSISVQIALAHNEGEADKFSSFEKFAEHNSTSSTPTSEVRFKYNFILPDPVTQEISSWDIEIQVISRIAQLDQFEAEVPGFFPRSLFSQLLTPTAKITVQHSDYVKARSVVAMFDEWVKGRPETPRTQIHALLKSYSHFIPLFGRFFLMALLAYSVIKAIDHSALDPQLNIKFLVGYASIFLIVTQLAGFILSRVEQSIDSYLPLSYIKMSKGDTKLIDGYSAKNRRAVLVSIAGIGASIVLAVFSNYVYDFLKAHL